MTANDGLPTTPWLPLSPQEVADAFVDAPFAWWLAGGYSIERHVGVSFRPHEDIDIEILRTDQDALREWLADWVVAVADPPGHLRHWPRGHRVPEHAHDIWARRDDASGWQLQIMLLDTQREAWVYRRDARIGGALDDLGSVIDGIPCLHPEIQLLYKSKSPRPKDEIDFEHALPVMNALQRATLRRWLQITNPKHPWLHHLDKPHMPTRGDDPVGLASGTTEIVPWDPRWPMHYASEAQRLRSLLADLDPVVEHVGSTSVVGMAAKPVIDIAVGLRDDAQVAKAHRRLIDAGYDGGSDRGPERGGITFAVGPRSARTHFIHLLSAPSPRWSDYLAFREALRSDPRLRRSYGLIKAEAAEQHPDDRPSYSDAKKPFILDAHARTRGAC